VNIVHWEDEPWDSGLAHYAVTLACEQARRGHRAAVWGRAGSPVLADAAERGLPTRGWAAPPLLWAQLPAMRRELAALDPRVINAHTGSAHALALLAAPKGAAVVRTRGDARPPRSNALTRLAAGRSAALIAANSPLWSALGAAFPGRPVRLVPQGIAGPERAAPLPVAPVVGMIARLDPVKGHDVLLRAAAALRARVPGLRVLCAGDGQLRAPLAAALSARGLEGVVSFLGRVPDREEFLARCRIGVTASTGSEAVSRAALEWMAAGRPLVATRVGGLPDLVADGVTGLLVPPGDPEALSDALALLLAEPARAEEMGRAARARWEKHFSLAPFYERTQAVYEEAIDTLPRRL
jgi:glycosyltransferase involved in cell wall biosynthesis